LSTMITGFEWSERRVMAAFQPYREVRDRWRQLPRISAGAPPPWPLDRNTAWASVEMAMSSTKMAEDAREDDACDAAYGLPLTGVTRG
jgi:hypothetical protein